MPETTLVSLDEYLRLHAADLAVNDPAAFEQLVNAAKAALPEDVNAPAAS